MNAAKYNSLRKAILDHMLGVTPWVAPTSVKVRAFTVAPTAAGGGTPVTGFGYADQTINWNGSVVPAASSTGAAALGSQIFFGFAAGGNWGTIVAIDIRRASNNELLWWATLDTPVTVNDGQGFGFNINDILWQET